jgi:site-specific recombinase XerD
LPPCSLEPDPTGARSIHFVHYHFSPGAMRAGIEKGRRNPHILKHSLASNLLRGGASVAYVQIALGHVDAKNTLRYTNVNDEEAAAVTGKTLDAIFAAA